MKWLKDYFAYKDLLFFFVKTNISGRYKQTLIGPAWAILEPLLSMVVFTFVFGRVDEISVGESGVPYPIFLFSGLLAWNYLRSSVSQSSGALVANRLLVQRVYFPRELLILSSIISGLFDFLISSLVLLALIIGFRVALRPQILLMPVVVLGIAMLSTGVGMILSAINAQYRDITRAMPYLLQLWMYVSPVIFPPSFLSGGFHWILDLNPMTGFLELSRHLILGSEYSMSHLMTSMIMTVVLFFIGYFYFKMASSKVVDLL